MPMKTSMYFTRFVDIADFNGRQLTNVNKLSYESIGNSQNETGSNAPRDGSQMQSASYQPDVSHERAAVGSSTSKPFSSLLSPFAFDFVPKSPSIGIGWTDVNNDLETWWPAIIDTTWCLEPPFDGDLLGFPQKQNLSQSSQERYSTDSEQFVTQTDTDGIGVALNLRAPKSYADLRSYTPSPVLSTASFPASLHKNSSPMPKGLSVLDDPLPASFDSKGVSHIARKGPFAPSFPASTEASASMRNNSTNFKTAKLQPSSVVSVAQPVQPRMNSMPSKQDKQEELNIVTGVKLFIGWVFLLLLAPTEHFS
jgi:hypothetical protein